jgi:hypothetical protein
MLVQIRQREDEEQDLDSNISEFAQQPSEPSSGFFVLHKLMAGGSFFLSFLTFRYICEYISHIFNFRQLVWENWFP